MFNLAVPFFLPVWRRVLVLAVCFGWSSFEFVTGAHVWGVLFLGAGMVAAWQFISADWDTVTEPDDE